MFIFLVLVQHTTATLVHLIEIFRHGARSPIEYQPWDHDGRWPDGEGQLSPEGMRQHYLLGTELRKRYIIDQPFLSKSYSTTELFVYSTHVNRTESSAQCQLMGLYPAGTGKTIPVALRDKAVPPMRVQNLDLLINELGSAALPHQDQVISIHSNMDNAFALDLLVENCIMIDQQRLVNLDRPDVLGYYRQYQDVLKHIQQFFKVNEREAIGKVHYLWDSILSNRYHGKPLPEPFNNDALFERMSQLAIYAFNLEMYSPQELVKISGSGLLYMILNELNLASEGRLKRKALLFSAHDVTVQQLLGALDIMDYNGWPPYASQFIIELHKTENEGFLVKTIYNDKIVRVSPCSTDLCPLSTFMKFLKLNTYQDLPQRCLLGGDVNKPVPDQESTGPNYLLIAIISVVALVSICVISYFIYKWRKNSTTKDPLLAPLIPPSNPPLV